jgi:hypothetical protein
LYVTAPPAELMPSSMSSTTAAAIPYGPPSEGRYGAELLGPSDLLRPWEHDGEDTLPVETSFRVIERLTVALLDLKTAARMAPYPQVTGALVGRAPFRDQHGDHVRAPRRAADELDPYL